MNKSPPLPQHLPHRFVATELLGEGGMARVWRAWDRQRGWCAVKILRDKYADQPRARRRFLDEARTLIELDHRNVVAAWEVGDQLPPFLVLEVADAGTLKDWITQFGPMPPHLAVGCAIQVCKGIGAAHKIGVIHRDIKPQNVLINRKGVCKVSDFGIARIRRPDGSHDVPDTATMTATTTGDALGTLGYMAPEQRDDGRRADVRADVYGIGAMLYALLNGSPHVYLFKLEDEPEALAALPAALRPVLVRAASYEPDARYSNVSSLARALASIHGRLPPDPRDTPSLTATAMAEPPPPPGVEPLANQVETPPASPTPVTPTRHSASPASASPASSNRRPVSPIPVVPLPVQPVPERSDLDLPRAGPRTRAWVVIAAILLMFVALGTGGIVCAGTIPTEAEASRARFLDQLHKDSAVIAELQALGADPAPLDQGLRAVDLATDPDAQFDIASAFVERLEATCAAVCGDHDARNTKWATDRIAALRSALERWRSTEDTWMLAGCR